MPSSDRLACSLARCKARMRYSVRERSNSSSSLNGISFPSGSRRAKKSFHKMSYKYLDIKANAPQPRLGKETSGGEIVVLVVLVTRVVSSRCCPLYREGKGKGSRYCWGKSGLGVGRNHGTKSESQSALKLPGMSPNRRFLCASGWSSISASWYSRKCSETVGKRRFL